MRAGRRTAAHPQGRQRLRRHPAARRGRARRGGGRRLRQAAAPAARSRPLLSGINLIGFVRTETGLGESCRMAAGALEAAKLPFSLIHWDAGNRARAQDTTWAHRESQTAAYKVNVIHMNADDLALARKKLGRRVFAGRFTIGYWHWELPDFPEAWCGSFAHVDEVWVPSTFVLDSVARKSPVPVVRIPHAIRVKLPPDCSRQSLGLPDHRFLFLTMFDAISVLDRKNPLAAIAAFREAFPAHDPFVGLVVKVNHAYPEALELLRQAVSGYPNIYLITEGMDRLRANALLQAADCVLSLHRAEGFGLILAEGMELGKPVIATGWSGNTDFMTTNNSCLVRYRLTSLGRDFGPYQAHQLWAEPDIAHAVSYMRRMVEDPAWRTALAGRGQQTIREQFAPEVVGERMRQRLQRLGKL